MTTLNNSILIAGFSFGSIYLFSKHYEYTMKYFYKNNRYIFDCVNASILALSGSIYVYMCYKTISST